jgi:V8-like Glu-specific endopeptidase
MNSDDDAPMTPSAIRRLRPIHATESWPAIDIPLGAFVAPEEVRRVKIERVGETGVWQATASGARAAALRRPDVARRRPIKIAGDRSHRDHPAFSEAPLPAMRPLWLDFNPAPALKLPEPAPRLRYRGNAMEPLIIHHPDDRTTYDDPSFPWGCVCQIASGNNTGCGVIIGPRHVLTASHVIDWNAPTDFVDVHVVGATALARTASTAVWSFTQVDDVTHDTVDEDYAVIVTAARIGDTFGFMGARTYNSTWDDEPYWRTIGYAPDVAGGMEPIYQRDFWLDEDELDLGSGRGMHCGADLVKGQSGSPIFGFWIGDPQVVAVVSAVGSDDANWASGGSLLTRLVREARAGDP